MNVPVRFSTGKHRKHVIARAVACSIMLLVLPACIPILRRPQPGPGLPESFNGTASSENSAQLGIDEFYDDPMLTCLIDQALSPVGNRELKILDEEIQIARNEILARSGAYLPFVSGGTTTGLDRYSRFTEEGAGLLNDPYLPGKFFRNPFGNYMGGINLAWQLDIYRQLRNARDAAAQRYLAAIDRRNYFVTHLVAEIAENYYGLVALDKRLENLDRTIELQERSLEVSQAQFDAARVSELPVRRFQAEVRKNQSEKLIVNQDIIQVENRINFLVNRFPQPVERMSAEFAEFFDLTIHALNVGFPSQLLLNRPDIRQAERDLAAAGLDVKVARVNFFPQLTITGAVGLNSFIMSHLFEPQAVIGNITGGLVGPLINFRAIKADYLTANAKQLQSVYNYQRVILNAFTEVINRLTMVENYRKSIEIKKQQLEALLASVDIASKLFQNPRENSRVDYVDVLFAQRDMMDARRVLIDTKKEQLSAVVNTYQALGGGGQYPPPLDPAVPPLPHDAAKAIDDQVFYKRSIPPPLPTLPPDPATDRALGMPATAPNDSANPGPQPADPKTSQSGSATDLPPALPSAPP
jgi:outer membrane protein, multidrug efflux system